MKKKYINPSIERIIMPEIMEVQHASYHNLGQGGEGGPFIIEIEDGGEIDDCAKGNLWSDDGELAWGEW